MLYDQVLEDQPEWINLTLEQKHDAIIALVGPKQRHSLAKIYVLTTYYGCLILVGVFGNLLTSWVISKSLVLQTPPNFYIFNLAIVDLITLLLGMYNCRGLKFWLLLYSTLWNDSREINIDIFRFSSSDGDSSYLALLSLVFRESRVCRCCDSWWAGDISFSRYNDCIYCWEVMHMPNKNTYLHDYYP